MYCIWLRIIITFPIFRFDMDLIIYSWLKNFFLKICDLPHKENQEIMYTLFNDYLVTLN